MQIPYPICLDCTFLDYENKKNGKPICKAFPDGISDEVIKEKSKPNIDKDKICNNGYKYEEIKD